jgi:uncharacterized Zn-binding protein involved in type VI secretion
VTARSVYGELFAEITGFYMAGAARVTDKHVCPKTGHTINAVASGEDTVLINGLPAATVGSVTSCGATIITGSSSVTINGKPAAIIGSATSHGGVIVGSSGNVFFGDMAPASATQAVNSQPFNQHFQLVDSSGKAVSGFTYLMNTPNGDMTGTSDSSGKTQLFHSQSEQALSLEYAYQTEIGVRT